MRKLLILLIVATSVTSAKAQTTNDTQPDVSAPAKVKYPDSTFSRWCVDLNFLGGMVNQNLTLGTVSSNYLNHVNDTISGLKFNSGSSMGFDVQGGYFFGKKRNFGIGTGIMYLAQKGSVTLDKFHIEYQRTDDSGYNYRQVLSANKSIKEDIDIKNINIPLLLKYKKRFSKMLSFNADAGLLFNIQMENAYTTDATFNYEEIRAFGVGGKTQFYDNSPVPGNTDVLLTQAAYMNSHKDATAQSAADYFTQLHNQGQNVGLGVSPTSKTGTVSYTQGTVGFLVRPTLGVILSDNVTLNLGVYYMYQPFKSNNNSSYKLTDNVGSYNSLLNASSTTTTMSYGASIGIRYYFSSKKDNDHDGVPNRKDRCPNDSGAIQFRGCPDSDGDGVPDVDDSCPHVAGLAKFFGCPDTDGDGIPDRADSCPTQPGLVQFNGCPDSDGDGIPDKFDACPYQAGPAKFNGCADTDGDGIPDNLDKCPNVPGPIENQGCPYDTVKAPAPAPTNNAAPVPVQVPTVKEQELPKAKVPKEKKHKEKKEPEFKAADGISIAAPVLFQVNKSEIRESSKPVLEEAIKKINENKDAYIIVEGYTDTTGPATYNKVLSKKRANVLRDYLINKGVSVDRIKSVGMGSQNPIESNETHAGRMRNRRAEMKWAK